MPDLIGQSIGRYHIVEQLGQGGMATVYKAYDTRLERDVAVKVIRTGSFPADQSEQILKRFEREAKSLARLSHPNIVGVIDYGEHEGAPYLVLVYLRGGTLKARMGQPMPWQEAARLLIPVANALEYAHEHKVIHRDVKPANILLTEKGQPMLSDFGIAKMLELEDGQTLTGTGVGIGTPEYMSPEQGMGREVDGRADIYSLGIIFYELLTGRKPYTADTPMAVIFKHISDPLPRPQQFAPDTPEAVEKVLFKALAKRPEDRFENMSAFGMALEALLTTPAAGASPVPAADDKTAGAEPLNPELPEKTVITNEPTINIMEAEATNVVATPPPEMTNLPQAQKTFPLKQALVGTYERSVQAISGLTATQKKAAAGGSLALALVLIALAVFRPAQISNVFFSSDRGGRIEVYQMAADGSVRQLTNTPGGHQSWSPSSAWVGGAVYFVSDRSSKTEIHDINSRGEIRKLTDSPGGSESWSPAPAVGGVIYFASNRSGKTEIYLINAEGQIKKVTDTPEGYESWSPKAVLGGSIYFSSNRSGKTEVYELNTQGQIRQITNTAGNFSSWSAEAGQGGVVYFVSDRSGKAEIYQIDSQGVIKQVTHTPGAHESWGPMFSLPGILYFTSDRSGQNEVYRLASDGKLTRFTNTPSLHNSWTGLASDKYPRP